MKAGDVSKRLSFIGVGSSLAEAEDILRKKGVDSLVVLAGQSPVGVLSAFEVLEKLVDVARLEDITVREVMNHNVLVFEADTDAGEAAKTMLAHKHWMAIITKKGRYEGVVTAGSLLSGVSG